MQTNIDKKRIQKSDGVCPNGASVYEECVPSLKPFVIYTMKISSSEYHSTTDSIDYHFFTAEIVKFTKFYLQNQ